MIVPGKCVLLLSADEGQQLRTMTSELKELSFTVVLARNSETALRFARYSKSLSLVVIDEDSSPVTPRFLTQLRNCQAIVPVMWLSAGGAKQLSGDVQPDAMLQTPVTVPDLQKVYRKLLFESYYETDLVESITDRTAQMLAERFHAYVSPRAPFIRASSRVLDNTTAVILFSGPGITAQLVLSASLSYLKLLLERMGVAEHATLNMEARDLAGEIANQVLGDLNRYFSRHGKTLTGSPPFFVSGRSVELEFKGQRPSLVCAFDEIDKTIWVEFSYDLYDTPAPFMSLLPPPPGGTKSSDKDRQSVPAIEDGEVVFL